MAARHFVESLFRPAPREFRTKRAPVLDRAPKSPGSEFIAARKAEVSYARRLRQIAKHVDDLVKGFNVSDPDDLVRLTGALRRYSTTLEPWARAVAWRMIAEVKARDKLAWKRVSQQIGAEIAQEIENAPTGEAMRKLLEEQVSLITSLPIEAAQRVHEIAMKNVAGGERSLALAEEILRTGEVTRSRATLIARTETARTASVLTQVRAQHVGSTHFQWLTAGDSRVRADHKLLNRQIFAWDDPPIIDSHTGERGLPGRIFNCRCIAVPVIPSD